MDLSSPETWRWIWLLVTVVFLVGELSLAGSFFLAPFAVGALLAALSAFAGAPLGLEWGLFLVGSVLSFAAMRPLSARLDRLTPLSRVGANRWVGREGYVLTDIPGGTSSTGRIRLDREEWRAESLTGHPIRAGSTVLVSRVDGTRLVVMPLDEPLTLPSEGVE